MGRWLFIGAWALIIGLVAQQAEAQCVSLRKALDLAASNFVTVQERNRIELDQMVREINNINNDALLTLLKASGQAQKFGELRNFLTQLKFVVQASENSDYTFNERMQSDLTWSNEVITTACATQDAVAAAAAVAAGDQPGFTGAPGERGDWFRQGHRKIDLRAEWDDAKEALGTLGLIFTGLAVAIISVWGARLWMHFVQKNRRSWVPCDVPAEFKCMMQEIPVRLCFISRRRCSFVPEAEEDKERIRHISAATFCTITTSIGDFAAQLAPHGTEDSVAEFRPALRKHTFWALVALSEVPATAAPDSEGPIGGRPVKT